MGAVQVAERVLGEIARFKGQLAGGADVVPVDRGALLRLLSSAEEAIGELVDHAGHLTQQHMEELLRLKHRRE